MNITDCRTKGTDGKHGRFNGADYKSQIENYVYPSLYKSPIIAGLTEYPASKNLQNEFNHQETENTKYKISNIKSTARGLSLKEVLVGGKIHEIKGAVQSITKVNYFKGKDTSQWKTNISTYEVVNLGEVYEGIDVKLRAYGSNAEKLFYVKPGANPDQIKIRLSGIQPPENPPPTPASGDNHLSPLEKGARGLSVNEHGELVAETELGPVKFTKPVAYQEIDGKRVEVECGYVISDCGIQESGGGEQGSGDGRKGTRIGSKKQGLSNPKSEIQNQNTVLGLHLTTNPTTSSSTPCWHPRSWADLLGIMVFLSL